MKLSTFFYTKKSHWSVSSFPLLDSPTTLILAFSAPAYFSEPAPLNELIAAYPKATIIGCSTGGEIFDSEIKDESVVVSVCQFEHTPLKQANFKIDKAEDSFEAGVNIAKELYQDKSLKGVFVLSDGIKVNGSELIKGLNSVLPAEIVVTGGLGGDGDRFKKTWVLAKNKLVPDCITAVGLYGDKIQIGHGSKGGWDTFGPERMITKSKNNVLYELDNKPALTLYKEYLGDRAKELPSSGLLFPLAIRKNLSDEKEIVRTILGIDEKNHSLIFAGDMPEGYLARLMRANFDRIVMGASDSALSAGANQTQAGSILAIAISCIGRRLLMGEYTEEEVEATIEVLPKNTQQIGFYSYGEISPFATGHCDLHNQTMTMTTFSEKI